MGLAMDSQNSDRVFSLQVNIACVLLFFCCDADHAASGVVPLALRARIAYCAIVRTTLDSGRVLFDESLSNWRTISSYFGKVDSGSRGTM